MLKTHSGHVVQSQGGKLYHTVAAHRVSLVLAAVQLMAVVENVFICGVQAGLHTVLYNLTGTRRTL